jgi:hypothetical protein
MPVPEVTSPSAEGIFVFTAAGGGAATVEKVAAGPFPKVQGYDWIDGWKNIEPSPGSYDFSPLLAAIEAAHAKGQLSQVAIIPGFEAPAWLLPECKTVPVVLGTGPATICVPTDPNFVKAWLALIAAAGKALTGVPGLVSVQTTGLGDQGEMILKHPSDGSSWASHGVDTQTLLAGWEQVIDAWSAAFPSTTLSLAIEEPIAGNQGDVKSAVLEPLLFYLQTRYGKRIMLQQNGLAAGTVEGKTSYWQDLKNASAWTTVGWQMFGYGSQNGDLETAFKTGLSAGGKFFQVYEQDIVNPSLTPALEFLAVVSNAVFRYFSSFLRSPPSHQGSSSMRM